MPRPFFMHIHIHSQTQRCTIRSKSAAFTVGSLTCSSGWQRPTERGERMAQESTGSEQTRGACSLDYRRKNKRSRLRK
ncbi:hypothetical protein HanRHA438_Chr08g0357431 [Helianthus annuus]|nr:hypothetical protein HanIR_MTg0917361 [Helianthus annuus]KAJ0586833.1 hypothetical protein HanIR_Chr04g0156261 [Helianthus annuus]KAJ0818970.1 hypothetical protein HanRHA438_MTg0865011 [Helianthus annuus]KAJ0898490.1 hypothetical protein HanRHA438_Chr08g0357431 [Helianthus annuus]KAJ0901905.1 hypothetical protein HanPSC8_Chr08g0330731 [Helianthus annuus]